ncbi:MAG: hypothetical protein MN733_03315 [Nitrososphaera sp.]|nr:hypothetical protein [Nitrososphaera sp.]
MARAKTKAAAEEDAAPTEELDIIELDQNLEDVEEPDLLPPGWYIGEIQSVEIRPNQAGTGRYFATKFVVPPENFPADYDPENWPDGCALYYNLVRVPRQGDRRAISNVKKFMQKLGLSLSTSRIDPNEWIGRRAKLKVVNSEYQGVEREAIAPNGIEAAD